ncbi:unnamed protein product [Blepharisma stoltei]|uniref:ubiquitinyl hydrolase 1 n=1 Tax=Blepharisma stoltei TaxID=1481888 RepID=A0AAU9J3X6_9CILI|nr:unnamed protein product [Blepharisma stoltei]
MENYDKAEALRNLGEENFRIKNFSIAIEKYSESFSLNPTIIAKYRLAGCYCALNQNQAALQCAKDALGMIGTVKIEKLKNEFLKKIMKTTVEICEKLGELDDACRILSDIIQTCEDSEVLIIAENMLNQLKTETTGTSEYRNFNAALKSSKDTAGGIFYVISQSWFTKWKLYNLGEGSEEPGPISNLDIIAIHDESKYYYDPANDMKYSNINITPTASEEKDYIIVQKSAYDIIDKNWSHDNTEIKRFAIALTDEGNLTQIEVRLKPVKVAVIPNFISGILQIKTVNISRKATANELKWKLQRIFKEECKAKGINNDTCKLWKVQHESSLQKIQQNASEIYIKGAESLKDDEELENAEIADEDIVILEFQKPDGTWTISSELGEICVQCKKVGKMLQCSNCRSVKYCSVECQRTHFKIHKDHCKKIKSNQTIKSNARHGLTGLQNLGNTCFMNSALQCVSHTIPLTEYILSNRYLQDINPNNPLGTKGAVLAYAYADLLKELWLESSSSVSPWNFKKTIAKVASQFSGYHQHDSHELLNYLLNGLHEDLNRVRVKPYIEQPTGGDRPDEIVAAESWNWFLQRNQSIIGDTMFGQCKSKLICPDCGKISITFDPFMTFSVAIPNYELKKVKVLFVYLDPSKAPIKISILLNMGSKVSKIKEILKGHFASPNVVIAVYSNNYLKGIAPDSFEVTDIGDRTLIAFESPELDDSTYTLPLIITKAAEKKFYLSQNKVVLTFMRLIFLQTSMTLTEIHIYIANMFKNIIENSTGRLFEDDEEGIRDLYAQHPPYDLRIYNQSKKTSGFLSSSKLPCDFCGRNNCENCNLPLSSKKTLKEMLDNRPNSEGPFVLELVWNSKAKGLSKLDKYEEDSTTLQDSSVKKVTSISLLDCLEHSCKPEKLDEDNKWYCGTCKTHVQATKSYQLYRAPPILILHLIRFKSRSYWTDKLNTFIDFPIEGLDLSSYILGNKENSVYDLYAVSNHYGSLGGGHYTAFVKNPRCESWVEMDDSHVTAVKPEKVASQAAYILFYKRRD